MSGAKRDRSARRDVRNPLLGLPAAKRLAGLPAEVRAPLASLLRELSLDARSRSDESWKRHKAPMAAYWKAVAVYANHLRRVIGSTAGGAA